jgi:hypothetical protein
MGACLQWLGKEGWSQRDGQREGREIIARKDHVIREKKENRFIRQSQNKCCRRRVVGISPGIGENLLENIAQ